MDLPPNVIESLLPILPYPVLKRWCDIETSRVRLQRRLIYVIENYDDGLSLALHECIKCPDGDDAISSLLGLGSSGFPQWYRHDIVTCIIQKRKAMTLACSQHGRVSAVQLLLQSGMNAYDMDSKALVDAASYGHVSVVKALLDAGADANCQKGKALLMACRGGHALVVDQLLTGGANVWAYDGLTLAYAAAGDHVNVAEVLISHGLRADCRNGKVLLVAAKNGASGMVAFLLNLGGDYESSFDFVMAMKCAIDSGHYSVTKILSAVVDCTDGQFTIGAAKKGNFNVMQHLLSCGGKRHIQDGRAMTAAASCGHISILQLIIAEPAIACMELSLRASFLHEPMNEAIRYGRLNVVTYLLSVGASASCQDTELSPLLVAAGYPNGVERIAILKLLLVTGGHSKRQLNDALYVAKRFGEGSEAVRLLLIYQWV